MIHVQIIGKDGAKLQSLVRSAIEKGSIKSFGIKQVRGGFIIEHAKHNGTVEFNQNRHILLSTIKCKNNSKEWQLLETFVGRLTYHFREKIASINIQFE